MLPYKITREKTPSRLHYRDVSFFFLFYYFISPHYKRYRNFFEHGLLYPKHHIKFLVSALRYKYLALMSILWKRSLGFSYFRKKISLTFSRENIPSPGNKLR